MNLASIFRLQNRGTMGNHADFWTTALFASGASQHATDLLSAIGLCCNRGTVQQVYAADRADAGGMFRVPFLNVAGDNAQTVHNRKGTEGNAEADIMSATVTIPMLFPPNQGWWLNRARGFVNWRELAKDTTMNIHRLSPVRTVGVFHRPGEPFSVADPSAPPVQRRDSVYYTETGYKALLDGLYMVRCLELAVQMYATTPERMVCSSLAALRLRAAAGATGVEPLIKMYFRPGYREAMAKQQNPVYEQACKPVVKGVKTTVTSFNAGTTAGLGAYWDYLVGHHRMAPDPAKEDMIPPDPVLRRRAAEIKAMIVADPSRHYDGPDTTNPLIPAGPEDQLRLELAAICKRLNRHAQTNPDRPGSATELAASTLFYRLDQHVRGLAQIARQRPTQDTVSTVMAALSTAGPISDALERCAQDGSAVPPSVRSAALDILATEAEPADGGGGGSDNDGAADTDDSDFGGDDTETAALGAPASGSNATATSSDAAPAPAIRPGVRPPDMEADAAVSPEAKKWFMSLEPTSMSHCDWKFLVTTEKLVDYAAKAGTTASRTDQMSAALFVSECHRFCQMGGELHSEGANLNADCRQFGSRLLDPIGGAVGKKVDINKVMDNLQEVKALVELVTDARGIMLVTQWLDDAATPPLTELVDGDGYLRMHVFVASITSFMQQVPARNDAPHTADASATGGIGDVGPPEWARNTPGVKYVLDRFVDRRSLPGRPEEFRVRFVRYPHWCDQWYSARDLRELSDFTPKDVADWLSALDDRDEATAARDSALPAVPGDGRPSTMTDRSTDEQTTETPYWYDARSMGYLYRCPMCDAQYKAREKGTCPTAPSFGARRHLERIHRDHPNIVGARAQFEKGPPAVAPPPLVDAVAAEVVVGQTHMYYTQSLLAAGSLNWNMTEGRRKCDPTVYHIANTVLLAKSYGAGCLNYAQWAARYLETWTFTMSDWNRAQFFFHRHPVFKGTYGGRYDALAEWLSLELKLLAQRDPASMERYGSSVPRMSAAKEAARSLSGAKFYVRNSGRPRLFATIGRIMQILVFSGVLSGRAAEELGDNDIMVSVKTTARDYLMMALSGATVEDTRTGDIGFVQYVQMDGRRRLATVEWDRAILGEGELVTDEDATRWDLGRAVVAIQALLSEVQGVVDTTDAATDLEHNATVAGERITGDSSAGVDAEPAVSSLAHLDLQNINTHGADRPTATVTSVPDVFATKVREAMLGVIASKSSLKKGRSVAPNKGLANAGVLTAGILAAIPVIARSKKKGKRTVRAPKKSPHRPAAQVADMIAYGERSMMAAGYGATRAATWQRHYAGLNNAAVVLEGSNSAGDYSSAPTGAATAPSTAWASMSPGARDMLNLMGKLRTIRAAIAEAERVNWEGVSDEQQCRLIDGARAVTDELAALVPMEAEAAAAAGMAAQGITPDTSLGD